MVDIPSLHYFFLVFGFVVVDLTLIMLLDWACSTRVRISFSAGLERSLFPCINAKVSSERTHLAGQEHFADLGIAGSLVMASLFALRAFETGEAPGGGISMLGKGLTGGEGTSAELLSPTSFACPSMPSMSRP